MGIAVDNLVDPKQLQMNIKQSKTDTFSLGGKDWIGKTRGNICPVAAVLSYMALEAPREGPLLFPE